MTQFDTDDDQYDDSDDEGGLVGDLRKQLRAAKKETKELRSAVESNSAAARRVAFLDANIPDTPQSRFFRDNYQGDLSADAIRTQATEYGFITDADHTADLAEVAAQSDAALGADGPAALGDHDEMLEAMDKAAREAPKGAEAKAIAEVVARYQRSPI